jgi:aminopeptidase N
LAVEQLSGRKDLETVAKLKKTLNEDSFFGVRAEAAKALRQIHTDEALAALLASTRQADARVRNEVVAALGGFYRDSVYDAARQTLAQEKNPDIQAHALRILGGYERPEIRETLQKFLNSTSYRNELGVAAIEAMHSQDDPYWVAPVLETLSKRSAEFTTRGFAQGLDTLAYLARNDTQKSAVREFLLPYINDQRKTVQLAAIAALGTLGDTKAIPALETLTTAAPENPERTAAEKAVADLRAGRKPVDDFKNLRREVSDLERLTRDLRKELDDLRKKVQAKETVPKKETVKKKP